MIRIFGHHWYRSLPTVLALLGLSALSFALGAAVVHFDLPSSTLLVKSFEDACWVSSPKLAAGPGAPPIVWPESDRSEMTCDGFTLYSSENACQATLIDMRGDVVRRWSAPFRELAPHVRKPAAADSVHFSGCRVYPDGDLLAVLEARGAVPYGHGLVRLDKDSKVRWRYSANVHDEFDLGQDGKIYALSHSVLGEAPAGLELFGSPCLVDFLEVLSPEGALLERIPIHEAFTNSAYKAMLGMVKHQSQWQEHQGLKGIDNEKSGQTQVMNVFGANFIQYLTPLLVAAARLPGVEAGQVLVSLGNLDTIAIIDVARRTVVWAATGPWRRQDAPQLLDNGHLLLLDSFGISAERARVLECDLSTSAFCWNYPGPFGAASFSIPEHGLAQRLPNGNTFIVNSANAELLEVSKDGEAVWRCTCPGKVPSARRYVPEQVRFLPPSVRPRP